MGSPAKKKTRVLETQVDRLSSLPDDLIHQILSFLDAKEALQTSVLSKRWKLVWTTLPFLNFGEYEHSSSRNPSSLIDHVMKHRYRRSHIYQLSLCVSKNRLTKGLPRKFIAYAISRNLENLSIELKYKHMPYKLSTLSSSLLKKLTLGVKLEDFASESDRWDLPALTYLRLKRPGLNGNHNLPDSCLTCLPALRTLCLDNWDFSKTSFSFSLPDLTTLRLSGCRGFPRKVWNFPALLSLELDNVVLVSFCLYKLVKLQNLTLTSVDTPGYLEVPFPQLLNLDIRTRCPDSKVRFEISAPKLYNFRSVGIFSMRLEAPVLENVNMKLQGWFGNLEWIYRKQYYRRFKNMLSQLGNAKNLTFDLESIEALSMISDNFAGKPSPFRNLKCVKLPHECNGSSIPGALRSYLIGGSSVGTIVTASPRSTVPYTEAVSMTAQNSALQEPLAAPAKEVDDTQYIHRTKTIDVDMHLQEEPVVEDSVGDADRVRDINPLVEETGKDPRNSSEGNQDFGLWQGHKLNSEFVCLLNRIMLKYPETFENFTEKSKKLCVMNLKMLCASIDEFTKISMTEVNSEMLVEYRDAFAYLQNKGFNLSWVVNRLDYIEHLRFSKPLIPELYAIDCCIDDGKIKLQNLLARVDDAKTELQDVQTLRGEKLTEIEKAFGTLGTNLAVGFIAGDLLSNP